MVEYQDLVLQSISTGVLVSLVTGLSAYGLSVVINLLDYISKS